MSLYHKELNGDVERRAKQTEKELQKQYTRKIVREILCIAGSAVLLMIIAAWAVFKLD